MSHYNTNQNRVIVYSQTGKAVGWIRDGILYKNADSRKHMLQKPPGWAWDKSILLKAKAIGVTKTVIHDKSSDIDYCANIDDFFSKGQIINRGFGYQICLPLAFWKIKNIKKTGPQQLAFGFEVKS